MGHRKKLRDDIMVNFVGWMFYKNQPGKEHAASRFGSDLEVLLGEYDLIYLEDPQDDLEEFVERQSNMVPVKERHHE